MGECPTENLESNKEKLGKLYKELTSNHTVTFMSLLHSAFFNSPNPGSLWQLLLNISVAVCIESCNMLRHITWLPEECPPCCVLHCMPMYRIRHSSNLTCTKLIVQ